MCRTLKSNEVALCPAVRKQLGIQAHLIIPEQFARNIGKPIGGCVPVTKELKKALGV